MQLSATQSNLIGTAGNIGMYACGLPVGLLVDTKGPTPAVLIGSIALGIGYFPIRQAFDQGPGSMSVSLLFFFSFLTGLGSCSAFSAAIKTSALNWPHHRGSATAFPLSAFGLSAFFFTSLSGVAFPHSTSNFLLLLSAGTFILVFVSMFFMRVPHHALYAKLSALDDSYDAGNPDLSASLTLTRTRSGGSKHTTTQEPGK